MKRFILQDLKKNADSDPKLEKVKDNLDAVAFGLSSFRSKYGDKMEKILKKGVNVRILTMNPNGNFVKDSYFFCGGS